MDRIWPLQDAKARLSEVIRAAADEPQIISVRGEPKVEVRAIAPKNAKVKRKPMTLLEALRACPKGGLKIPPRRYEPVRKIDLG